MSKVKARAKVPKEASIDEVIEVKTLLRHPMHSGRMKDSEGNVIPRKIINKFTAYFNDNLIHKYSWDLKRKNIFYDSR